ncbi:hypothetical protein ACWGS9_08135, partial [Bradyrhizobium sp. Arg314]
NENRKANKTESKPRVGRTKNVFQQPARAFHRFTETANRSIFLFLRNSGRKTIHTFPGIALDQDDVSLTRHPDLTLCWSMILSENRVPLFGIML